MVASLLESRRCRPLGEEEGEGKGTAVLLGGGECRFCIVDKLPGGAKAAGPSRQLDRHEHISYNRPGAEGYQGGEPWVLSNGHNHKPLHDHSLKY